MTRKLPYPVFDADNHFYEPKEALTQFLPDHRKNVIDYIEVRGRTKIMKGDALELRRAHAAHEADALQAGQRAVVDADSLPVPSHTINSNLCSIHCQALGTTIDFRLAGSESLFSASATWSRS